MLTLFTYFRSSASYRVRIGLHLKGQPYASMPIHLLRNGGEQHSAEFSTLNPARLVPVLMDGPHTLTQSLAILEYLEERFPERPLLPGDPAARARVRSIAQAIACDIHPLNNLRVLKQLESGLGASSDTKDDWYRHWVVTGFRALERELAESPATGTFCHGDTPTLADCCLVPQVYNARRFNVDLDPFPTIRRIERECLAMSAFMAAAPEAQLDAA